MVVASKGNVALGSPPPKPLPAFTRNLLAPSPAMFTLKLAPTLVSSNPLPMPSWAFTVSVVPLMAVMRPSTSPPLAFSSPSTSLANKLPLARVKPSTVTTWLSRPATPVTPSLNSVVASVLKVINEPVVPTLKVKLDPFTAVTVPWTSSISPSSSCWFAATPGDLAVILKEEAVKAIPFTTPAAVVLIEAATFTSMFRTRGLLPIVRLGLRGTLIEALAGPLMWTGVPAVVRNVSSEFANVRFAAENVPCGRLPATNGSNFPEAWVNSMRLLAGTVTETGAPPPAGASEQDDTETSKAMTLSAGASPKRTCAEFAPAGVGVGLVLDERPDPPPPQPETNAMSAASAKTDMNLVTGLIEVLCCVFICISPGGDQAA